MYIHPKDTLVVGHSLIGAYPFPGSKSGEYEEVRERPFTKLLGNGSLLLQHVKEDREGFYLCQANNGIGTGIGKVIQLKVNCEYLSEWQFG